MVQHVQTPSHAGVLRLSPDGEASALYRVPVQLLPARRVDLLTQLSGAFDLAESQPLGHANRVAHLSLAVARRLRLDGPTRRRTLYAALLHDSGVAVRVLPPHIDHSGGHTASGAWIASLMGLDEDVQHIIRATHERWDGEGRPRRYAMDDIPVEALLISAAHWVSDVITPSDHPLRARAALKAVTADDLEPLVGLRVGRALVDELRSDEVWMRLWAEDLAVTLAADVPGEGRASHQHVDRVAAAMGEVVDSAMREEGRAANVAALASEIGRRLGFGAAHCRALRLASLLLDLGQLGVPRDVTEKPALLTVDEMEQMERHPGVAAKLLEAIPGFAEIAHWVETHHERPDGRGYPEQLTAAELPLASRILAVSDSFWALCADRPYRGAYSPEEAIAVIEAAAGEQYDLAVVAQLRPALAALRARNGLSAAAA
jgi:HD-GYP domain-containing protein (c-di-GMP phosphodiesterase class II)